MKHPLQLVSLLILLLGSLDAHAQLYRFSEGLYRVPYEDDTEISMTSDVWSHNPPGKYDMSANVPGKRLAAAADGWIREIVESNDTTCASCCGQFNNYVAMEHPNGEWSTYIHMQQWSVTSQGVSVDQWITAGTLIGVEGTVGCSSGDHLHWEVGRPAPGTDPVNNDGSLNAEFLIPVICDIGMAQSWFVAGEDYVAGPCADDCPFAVNVGISVGFNAEYLARGDNFVITSESNQVIFYGGSATQFRAENYILLRDGFEVRSGAKFEGLLKACNEQ